MSFNFWSRMRNRREGLPLSRDGRPEVGDERLERLLDRGLAAYGAECVGPAPADPDAVWLRVSARLETRPAPRVRPGRALALAGALAAVCAAVALHPAPPARVVVEASSLQWVREARDSRPSVDDPLGDSTDRLWSALDRVPTQETKP